MKSMEWLVTRGAVKCASDTAAEDFPLQAAMPVDPALDRTHGIQQDACQWFSARHSLKSPVRCRQLLRRFSANELDRG
jgi:hypothetical protein